MGGISGKVFFVTFKQSYPSNYTVFSVTYRMSLLYTQR